MSVDADKDAKVAFDDITGREWSTPVSEIELVPDESGAIVTVSSNQEDAHCLLYVVDFAKTQERRLEEREKKSLLFVRSANTPIRLSQNPKKKRKRSGNTNLFWQSDGGRGSHWIRIQLPSTVERVMTVEVYLARTAVSFLPEKVETYAGHSLDKMVKICTTTFDSFTWTTVLGAECPARFVELRIRKCHQDGQNTRVAGIRISCMTAGRAPLFIPNHTPHAGHFHVKPLVNRITS